MHKPCVTLDHYVTFLKVADTHRIDQAADALGLSASAVRKQIESTQSALGTRLFEHSQGLLSLTGDGQAFYEDAHKIVEMAGLAEERIAARRQMRERHIHLGHSTNLPPRLVAAIHRLHIPEVGHLAIHHVSGLTTTILRQVLDGSLHAGVGVLPVHPMELLIRVVGEEPLVVSIPSGHRLGSHAMIAPQDLDGEPMIAIAREPWPERHREIEEHLAQFGARANVVADAYSAPEALGLVEHGVGLCLVPRSSVSTRYSGMLRPLATHVLKRRYGIFFREDNLSPLLHALAEAASHLARSSQSQTRLHAASA